MPRITTLLALASGVFFSHAHASALPLTGHFVGSGRACYGTLALTQKTISWNTAFSHCKARPFHLVDDGQAGGKRRLAFEFTATASACRFRVISLTHDETSGLDTGWEATGYADLASYQTDKRSGYATNAPDMMSCALVRDPASGKRRSTK
jgi:hypothetical protein